MEPSRADFVEGMGLAFERDGLPRIAGRLLGLLLLSPEPRSLDDLAGTLSVSKSSASTNARLLSARLGLLRRVSVPGDRRDYYEVAERVYGNLLESSVTRLERIRSLVSRALDRDAAGSREGEVRLEQMRAFCEHVLAALHHARESWEPREPARRSS
ncbi:MAG: MarR family transcriptional regulator [Gemmatimonadota bacterium]|jgi:DNA-binding transcriptional regulator GbsR (MarR family)